MATEEPGHQKSWWCHQMETFSALLALCAGNSPVTGEFPSQRPVTRSVGVFFELGLNERLSKQSWGWWFETPSFSLWRHCNGHGIGLVPHRQILDSATKSLASPLLRSRFFFKAIAMITLQWRPNGRDGVSNHQPLHSLLNRDLRRYRTHYDVIVMISHIHTNTDLSTMLFYIYRPNCPLLC